MSEIEFASDMLAASHDYINRGWHPLQLHHARDGGCSCGAPECRSPGKHPVGAWKQHQTITADSDVLGKWFPVGAPWNIGLAHGSAAGTIALDFDGHAGLATKAQLERELGPLPITPLVLTGGGGEHHIYRHPGQPVPTRKNVGPGLDVRGDGGLTVAPPSLHASGQTYAWSPEAHPDNVVVEDLPAAWVDFICAQAIPISTSQVVPTSGVTWDQLGDDDPKVVDGREQYMRDTVMAVLHDQCHHLGRIPQANELFAEVWDQYRKRVDFGRPGRGPDEVLGKCQRAVAKAVAGRFHDLDLGNGSVDPAPQTPDPRDVFPVLTVSQAVNLPPPQWLIRGLLVKDSVAALYGPPASLKSFLAVHLGMTLAHGLCWAGRPLEASGVCYVAAEGAGGVGARLEGWEQHHGVKGVGSPFRLIPLPVNLVEPEQVNRLVRTVLAQQAAIGVPFRLVVLDTLARCTVGVEENSSKEFGVVMDAAIRIKRETGATVLVVHHTGKDVSRGMRGSNRTLADVDTAIEVERDDDGVVATVRKQKDAPDGDKVEFTKESVRLPYRLGREIEGTLVLVRNDERSTRLGKSPAKDDDRRRIATLIEPGSCITISKLIPMLGLGRGSNTYDRVAAAIPLGDGIAVETDAGRRILRRTLDPATISCATA